MNDSPVSASNIWLTRPSSRAVSKSKSSPVAISSTARDAYVRGQGNLEAAADAVPVDGGDDELRRLLQPGEGLVGVEAEEVFEGRRDLRKHPDVRARAEEL